MNFKKIQAIIDNIFLSEFPQIIEIAYNDPDPDRVLIWAYTRVLLIAIIKTGEKYKTS